LKIKKGKIDFDFFYNNEKQKIGYFFVTLQNNMRQKRRKR